MMTGPSPAAGSNQARLGGRRAGGELEIRGEDSERAGAGKVGQLMLRGPSVMPGYLRGHRRQPTGLRRRLARLPAISAWSTPTAI